MTPKAAYEIRMIGILSLMFGFVFFDRNAMSYLGPYVREELGLSFEQLGTLSSGLSFAWAIAGLGVGYFSDRTGRRKSILLTTVVIFSVCSALSVAGATPESRTPMRGFIHQTQYSSRNATRHTAQRLAVQYVAKSAVAQNQRVLQ